jgi:hypothetical protein
MKILSTLLTLSSITAAALPARAQDNQPTAPPDEKVDLAEEPAQPSATTTPAQAQAQAQGAAAELPAAREQPGGMVQPAGNPPSAKARQMSTLGVSPSRGGGESEEASSEWKTDFHGYFRAPFRFGIGSRPEPKSAIMDQTQAEWSVDDSVEGQSSTTFHMPVIPDGQYLSWQSTSHNRSDWAEIFFGVYNAWARATIGIQGYNFTDASFNDPLTQYGIGQAYVTLTPDLGYENFRLALKVGAYQDKYGAAGKYDAGEYDTYLFGRTHAMGETLRIEYDLTESWLLWFEHGLGGKRPDPSSFNNSRFTMLTHGHVGLHSGRDLQFSAHMLYSWAQEEDRPYDISKQISEYASSVVDVPDGNLWVAGVDARLDLGAWGYFYGGYSHIGAKDAIVVGRAIEVLHASGGGEYQLGVVDNYFGPGCTSGVSAAGTERTGMLSGPGGGLGPPEGCSRGTGSVDSLLAQYEFSLTNFQQMNEGGQRFWGQGSDLKLVLYGMVNFVQSDYRPVDPTVWGPTDGNMKLKYGADIQWHVTPSVTAAMRADRLQPNSEIPEQSFSILSPRVVFSSNWVSREALTFQYSRYIYNQRECAPNVASPAGFARNRTEGSALCVQPPPAATPPEGFGANSENQDVDWRGAPTTRPDVNVFKIEATFWW